jgi:hypothetical protein
MGDITKVKLMDSGTARFPAGGLEDAERRVRAVLSIYGEVSPGSPGTMILDTSDRLYNQFITVKLEPTSTEGQWAASFREGNSATWLGMCLLRLGAHSKCHKRMRAILKELDNC